MGISRRKSGMTVNCPTCHAQLVVPQPEAGDKGPQSPPQPMPAAPAPLFERSDFEAFLDRPIKDKPAAAAPPPPQPLVFSTEKPSSPSLSMLAPAPGSHPSGLVLSPKQATWLTIMVILLVALAFGAGLLVGHWLSS